MAWVQILKDNDKPKSEQLVARNILFYEINTKKNVS